MANKKDNLPDSKGHFGIYGGVYVAETLVPALKELAAQYELIKKNKNEAGCVYADEQTKGRGTHGKDWISKKGNLFSSIFFILKDNYPPFNEFAIINSIIISDVIKNFCTKQNINLKFPNDIFVNGKKICGILQ